MGPLISIILPVYNQEQYVKDCIDSMLLQTYRHFELIAIDDACTDRSAEIIRGYSDPRIILITNETNRGLAYCVNNGIARASGEFIARMDADDIAHPQRLEKQVSFLLVNPEISILGSAMQSFGHSDYLHRFPLTHAGCQAQLLFNVCFGHPTVMIRRAVFDNPDTLYREELKQYSEEYELWSRLVDRFTFANLPDVLLYYRTFDEKTKQEAGNKRKTNSFAIRTRFLNTQLGVTDETFFEYHNNLSNLEKAKNINQLNDWILWLKTIFEINKTKRAFDENELKTVLLDRKFEIYYWNSQLGLKNWFRAVYQYPRFWRFSFKRQVSFFIRSLLAL